MTKLNYSNMSDSLVLFSSDDEDSEINYETKQYNNFTAMLKGVPPPSSITISKFTVEEMLQRYKNYKDSSGFFSESENYTYVPSKKNSILFLKCSNSSHISENIASVVQKVQERYVQLETMSSCNLWFNATLQSCGSAKKRQRMRQRLGLSPGRRLSHLARRRQFFSSANLQRLANTDVRQIEIKKSDSYRSERRKINRTVEHEKLNSSKRALFLSPENGTPIKYGNTVSLEGKVFSSGSDEGPKLPLQDKSKKIEVLKWLSQQNFDADLPRKRLRGDCASYSQERKRKCPRRSLNFADEEVGKSSNSVATSDSSNSTKKRMTVSLGKLSQNHKNKLLWAVSVVLKENNISRNDHNFKTCASTLFHKCRRNFDEILNIQSASGTSEKILQYARKEIPDIFNELGIQCQVSDEKKTEKKAEESSSIGNNNEMKENINQSNSEGFENSKSKCLSGESDFVFKTPNKVCRKRPVKSCQKDTDSVKKIACIRKWRSLESLTGDDIQKSCLKTIDKLLNEVSALESSNRIQNSDEIEAGLCTLKESSAPLIQETVENKGLTVDELSVLFSPIPSSLKDEQDSPETSFPALNRNPEKSEVNSDANSVSSEANDSAEILNQDKEIDLCIETLLMKENFISQTSDNIRSPCMNGNDSLYVAELAQNHEKLRFDNEHNVKPTIEQKDRRVQSSPLCADNSEDKTEECNGDVGECSGESKPNAVGTGSLCDIPSSRDITTEKAVYKPRKLVVKKSKPNWKVVRKNSEEAENESDLRLKMRLSHEWEVVCRNSSCSDIGNASECEAASVNCSQISSINDEKDISSEEDADESNKQSSVHSTDESMDQEWEKSHSLLNRDGKFGFYSVRSNLKNDSQEKISKYSSVYENGTEKLLRPDVSGQPFENHQHKTGSSDNEECCNNSSSPNLLKRRSNSRMTEKRALDCRQIQTSISDKVMVNGANETRNICGNVLPVPYGENHDHEGGRSFAAGHSHSQYKREDSPILFIKNHSSNENNGSKKRKSRHLISNPQNVVEDNCIREREWDRSLNHNNLKIDNPLLKLPNGRRDCCL